MQELNITIPKCDYLAFPFTYRVDGKNTQLNKDDIIYFSIKKDLTDETYILQKTLGNGIDFDEKAQKYYVIFNYEDTEPMKMGVTYVYDLTIYYEGTQPSQKLYGTFKIGPKVTLNKIEG